MSDPMTPAADALIEDFGRNCRADGYAHTDNTPGTRKAREALEGYVADLERQLAEARNNEAKVLRFLLDPSFVHIQMLRGKIAVPSWRNIVHLRGEVPNGEDVQLARIAELQEQLTEANALRERDGVRLDYLESTGWPSQFAADPAREPHRRWFDCETTGSDYSPTLRAAIDAAIQARKQEDTNADG
jgi:hypothetical protein